MAEAINVMIALQTPDGLSFGYVLDASPRHVVFTCNNNLPPGVSFAWRMELKGYAETIMGRLTVTRAYPARTASEWPRYEGNIDDIPPEDGVLLKVWMEDQEKGGSSRRIEKDPARFIKDMFSEGMRGASSASTKLVIDRMNERRVRREALFKQTKRGVGGDFGLSVESKAASHGSSVSSAEVRSRITAALGGFSRRKLEEEPPPPAPPLPPPDAPPPPPEAPAASPPITEHDAPERAYPTASTGVGDAPAPRSKTTDEIIAAALHAAGLRSDSEAHPTAAPDLGQESSPPRPVPSPEPAPEANVGEGFTPSRPVPNPEPAPTTEPEPEPGMVFDPSSSPALLRIRYPQAGDYAEDYRRHLKNGGLFIKGQQIGARGDTLQVELIIPGEPIACSAQVVAVMAAGTGLMLNLTKDQRAALAAAAG